MRKASREMNSDWALEIMRKAPYITLHEKRWLSLWRSPIIGQRGRQYLVFSLRARG